MKCPHCTVEFHDEPKYVWLGRDTEGNWVLKKLVCPNPLCKKDTFFLLQVSLPTIGFEFGSLVQRHLLPDVKSERLIRPKGSSRPSVPKEVPHGFFEDYMESCLVLSDSPKASAALSRRCLQHILREKGGFKAKTLDAEIKMALESKTLPHYLAESIDGVRNIGNFAAHPIKSQQSGEILPVEPGEAEWNLEVIEMLFEFYFVQPEKTRLKREALNQKLHEAGKPSMK